MISNIGITERLQDNAHVMWRMHGYKSPISTPADYYGLRVFTSVWVDIKKDSH